MGEVDGQTSHQQQPPSQAIYLHSVQLRITVAKLFPLLSPQEDNLVRSFIKKIKHMKHINWSSYQMHNNAMPYVKGVSIDIFKVNKNNTQQKEIKKGNIW